MENVLNILTEPLAYNFITRGMFALVLIGGVSAVIGCFVVVRGLSFFGDALAHTVLPGVALSYTWSGGVVGANLFAGGLVAGIISALLIAFLTRNERLKEDTAIGLVFVTMFALGVAIISTQGSYSLDLTHILFGSINGISQSDLEIMSLMGALVVITVLIFYKQFLIISFDMTLAHTLKLPVEFLRILLLILIAVTIVASLQAVGIALMLALLIAPPATARLLVNRLHYMIMVAAVIGILSGIFGFYLSYYFDVPSGASIVLTMSSLFAIVFVAKSIWDWAKALRSSPEQEIADETKSAAIRLQSLQ